MTINIGDHTINSNWIINTAKAANKPKELFGKSGAKEIVMGIFRDLGLAKSKRSIENTQKENRTKIKSEMKELTTHLEQIREEIAQAKLLNSNNGSNSKDFETKILATLDDWNKTKLILKDLRTNLKGTKAAKGKTIKQLFHNANLLNRLMLTIYKDIPQETKQQYRINPRNIPPSEPTYPEIKPRTKDEIKELAKYIKSKSKEDAKNFEHQRGKVGSYQVSVMSVIGSRETMEDTHLHEEIELKDGTKIPLFAVIDGHGGADVSKAIASHFPDILKEELDKFDWKIATLAEKHNFFKRVSDVIETKIESLKPPLAGGATMTAAIIINNQVWTMNTGDARTVLNNNGKAIQLTEDAKLNDEKFLKGVRKRGGKVYNDEGIPRVRYDGGGLSVARSYGDIKKGKVVPGITHRAKVTVLDLKTLEKGKHHLVLACDGVWDVIGSKEAVGMIKGKDSATALAEAALKKGSKDNVTAMVVKLP